MRIRSLTRLLIAVCAAMAMACGSAEGNGATPDTTSATTETPVFALIDPNEATRDQLLALPHFDAALADALLAARPFDNMLEVDSLLAGRLTETHREEVYGRLFKPLDLNGASGAEILLIPGVGERMEHEFLEYRPYRAMAEFRREIGKYVDEDEVARLEQYVMLP